jgi:hypothetical protein
MKTLFTQPTEKHPVSRTNLQFFVIVMGLFFLFPAISVSQEIVHLGAKITSLQSQQDPMLKNEGNRLQSLANDLHPMIYIKNGNIESYGSSSPVFFELSASELHLLHQSDARYNDIEFLRIKVETEAQLNGLFINVSNLNHFPSLKYLHFECAFHYSSSALASHVAGNDDVSVLFSVSIAQ